MTTEIKNWEIVDGRLVPVESRLADFGRREALDLKSWLESDPSIIRPGLRIIGRQVPTRSGPLDLLAIDRTGSVIVIELKRDRLPREALAQAIDYAADVATWSLEKLGEVCASYSGEVLEDVLGQAFPDIDLESLTINGAQRIVLVGFALESALERMIEWLSEAYGVAINAVVLKYVRTANGAEILTRSAVISEEEEEARSPRKLTIPMSDEPGSYPEEELRPRLVEYLSRNLVTIGWIRDLLLPACLEYPKVTRDQLKELVAQTESADAKKVGLALGSLSSQLGRKENDFLRQVLGYSYPNHPWEKDDFFIRQEYRGLVAQVLKEVRGDRAEPNAAPM
jgi:Endonuclease NucS C-terminal domain